ncbi:glycosyltransferase [Tessaracoccus sp.]
MDVVLVSTYPPTKCGIATFAEDVREALLPHVDSVRVVASLPSGSDPPDGAIRGFLQASRADHVRAASAINASGGDVVLMQHEFGIYGGRDGEYVLDLAAALELPYCVTLHTVLAEPSPGQTHVTRALCSGARSVFVFSPRARRLLVDAGLVDAGKVTVVPHGAPRELMSSVGDDDLDGTLSALVGIDVHGRRVVSTFGLLSPGKGLEHAIRAIPLVVDVAPDLLYVVAGATHPEVVKQHGEAYRHELEDLVLDVGAEDHVVFVDRYLEDDELIALLRRSHIFVTPYPGREQVVSGTLTFAIAAGCAVVSTPYYHAEDLAASGAVLLADFDDTASLAEGLRRLLSSPDTMASARRASATLAAGLAWDVVGEQLAGLLADAIDQDRSRT